ncbi:hypothetical protein HETIRDRAFT_443820 [Heterobasidion irregulare TC 32-1]|uniref:RNA-dependent RNA polymerase n=1 Tax=Heterobasidion irregulare (strain TC 32-1) TaxID=747525 RepID=W4KLR4_HETIT|nr:uncharacterized protein HETIRDRAFT_443820 [Heterobasidion irregulare TC 32-1]ETW86290.1 hypothetical protein HETIRDRAFT_443820 [Heterobasidion irregulare TC 32-1]
MYFARLEQPPYKDIAQTLERSVYVGPEKQLEREEILRKLDQVLRVAKVQFGIWFKEDDLPDTARSFSIEYERDLVKSSAGLLDLVYDRKMVRIEMGESMTEEQCIDILIKFSNIKKIGLVLDSVQGPEGATKRAAVIFDMLTPPILEERSFNNRPREGIQRRQRKDRDRIPHLDESHKRVAPYAHQLRVILYDYKDILRFEQMCRDAQCQPQPVRIGKIKAFWRGFFAEPQVHRLYKWVSTMPWAVAFQVEALLRNGLVNTRELLDLQRPIDAIVAQHGSQANEILRQYSVALRMRKPHENPLQCFERACTEDVEPMKLSGSTFACHHVTFTPTRLLLEGPYVMQSNSVIRKYPPEFAENFIRVDFKDEDRLSYRFEGKVDATWFLQVRVGDALKKGFELAGRRFEFLGYSTSALREHAVWFVAPFEYPKGQLVTAETIRQSLGDFSGVIRQPSKYAARLAQAFTATETSVEIILPDQLDDDMPDLGKEPYIHTDGVGTISPELGDMIWQALCRERKHMSSRSVKPSAYQIRFMGYKGVVVVDDRLKGIKMRLRKSMKKFVVPGQSRAKIEIARDFNSPNFCYFNRPIVMTLEDREVRLQAFLDLQEKAKASVYMASDSLANFRQLLRDTGLGAKFRLPFILEQLEKLDLDFKATKKTKAIDNPFLDRLVRYTTTHALRDMKYRARIRIPNSYLLVGVADEGQAYIQEGLDPESVLTLEQGQIFACVQESPDLEPKWLKGWCVLSRSPVVHPGDVQRVWAVGQPPEGKVCFYRNLKNVVVFPAVGERSLASCLGGGDLDGDLYDVYAENPRLLPTLETDSATYLSAGTRTIDRDSTVDDICDFVVEYINSDVLAFLATRHLIIAGQSMEGTYDKRCMDLAQLCSQAVDYMKNGIAVDVDKTGIPRPTMKFKPDWTKAEITGAREADYYESQRALGHLYRNIELQDPKALDSNNPAKTSKRYPPLSDPISRALRPLVQRVLARDYSAPDGTSQRVATTFARYARELQYIIVTHTLSDAPDVRLMEEEIVVGTILANCTENRWRKDRMYRMRLHAETLVRDIRRRVQPDGMKVGMGEGEATEQTSNEDWIAALGNAWEAWDWSLRNERMEGARSFGLIMLGLVLDCLQKLDALPLTKSPESP